MARTAYSQGWTDTTYSPNFTALGDYLENQTTSATYGAGRGFEIFETAIVFNNPKTGKRIGELTWKKGKLEFEGEVGESAKKFLEVVKNYINLEKMRK